MRTTALSLLVLLAFSAQPCWAQSATPEKAAAPQSAAGGGGKSDDALSPSTLPKERQAVKENAGTARLDSLSPDEVRRIERARARAHPSPAPQDQAAGSPKGKPAPKQASEPAPAPAAKAVAAAPAAASAPARRQADVVRHDHARHAARARRDTTHDTADLDGRRARPSRHASMGERWRAPRVGDVIPRGVALYPLPPGYGAPRASMRAPLPFPRDEADDDFGPPRSLFMAPY